MLVSRPCVVCLVAALSTTVVVACAGPSTTSSAPPSATPPAPATFALDESKLPTPVRLATSDLDESKSPCADLNAHANSRWLDQNALPGDRTTWGAFEVLDERSKAVQRQLVEQAAAQKDAQGIVKLIGDLWATGMDEAAINAQGLKPLQSRLDAVAAITDAASIAEFLRASAKNGEFYLFSFGPEADFKNSSMNMAYASQGGLGLPDKGYYTDADKKEKRDAYAAHVKNVLVLAGDSPEVAAAGAAAVMAIETRMAAASRSREELSRDVSLYYNPVSVEAADAVTPAFSWTRFFDAQGIEKPTTFSLAMPEFHAEVSKMLGEVPVADWRAYFRFHTVDSASPFLGDAFVNEHFAFYRAAMRGQKEIQPRHKRVLDAINGSVGEALGQLYVDVAFSPEAKARMKALVGNLSAALKLRLEKLDWMGPETKKKALEKWASFTPKIGYPDKWRDWSGLQTTRGSYIENVLAARGFNYRYELSKIGKPVDKTEWGMSPQTVNAYYNPLQNEIVFPAAILQPPFFDLAADDPVNYGGIGAVIGHEMIHGYDDQGSRFGASGNFEVWWTKEDTERFEKKTQMLIDQFSAYEAFPGGKVNGKLTLGENIADLGGLAVAYDAMKEATAGSPDPMIDGRTRDQRFFLGWSTVWRRKFTPDELKVRVNTDPHAPAGFRANGPPSNSTAFQAAFQCKDSDAMVRAGDKRIVIW